MGFPSPKSGTVFYEDELFYACLAFHPMYEGHVMVVVKTNFHDLSELPENIYCRYMKLIFRVRKAMQKVYQIDKVYLCYLDEANHVHCHLIPRLLDGRPIKDGFNMLCDKHFDLTDFSKVPLLAQALQ